MEVLTIFFISEELREVERELAQANKTIQQQVQDMKQANKTIKKQIQKI